MSKKIKGIVIGLISLIIIGAGGWLLRPKIQDSFVEKEISIKQAGVGVAETLIYEDLSGFSFEYSSDLKIEEVELEEPTVYSSLEMSGSEPGKLILRISDTKFSNLDSWLKEFETKQVINELKTTSWDDLKAIQFSYQVPKLRKTVAVDNQISYIMEAPADDGYWDNMQETIRSSFKFDPSIFVDNSRNQPVEPDGDEVILLEESLE